MDSRNNVEERIMGFIEELVLGIAFSIFQDKCHEKSAYAEEIKKRHNK